MKLLNLNMQDNSDIKRNYSMMVMINYAIDTLHVIIFVLTVPSEFEHQRNLTGL